MRKVNAVYFNEIVNLGKKWFVLCIWALIFLAIMQTAGIVVHEFGHYTTGNLYGYNNLTISIAKISIKDSISNVSGWEYCKTPLVMAENGSRICHFRTNVISFAGLVFSLLIFIPFFLIINAIIKRKFKKGHLSGHFLAIMIIFIFVMAVKSAVFDLFKIGECLFNTSYGEIILRNIDLLSNLLTLIIIIFFIIDLLKIFGFFFHNKQTSKKETSQ